mgnify:CR=1 FL=1
MEIGSIFEINPEDLFSSNNRDIEFPFMEKKEWNMQFFNTGRSAIESFLNVNAEIQRVWCPSFICSSVIDAIIRAEKEIKYYPIDRELHINIEFLHQIDFRKGDALYLVQYFGVSEPLDTIKIIEEFRSKGVLIFEDITMSLLSDKDSCFAYGDVVIGSIRKWCGIPDGAFIASGKYLPMIEKDKTAYDYTLYYFTAQILKSLYLSNPEKYDKEEFLSFSELGIKSLFSDYTVREMSEMSYKLLRTINWGGCCLRRHKNYELLYSLLQEIPEIKTLENCNSKVLPLGMFILTEDRDGLLNHLISKDVYCNVHWRQNVATEQFSDSAYLSRHCLTIPCDHRYEEKHMRYIYNAVKEYYM